MISFAQKTFSGGVLTSKLHVIELGAQPGEARSAGGAACALGLWVRSMSADLRQP